MQNLNMKSIMMIQTIKKVLSIVILNTVFISLYIKYQPLCEPCLNYSDCPPCISDQQVVIASVGIILNISLFVFWIIKRAKN